ncbi:cytochrome p450 domain-containing protein [Penicillium angulare]|uniref:Cytochrome p450 domain-containing protein n=1 Tax=Penicillium angulare TaxID=116970 RepID=A0A9W9K8D1_9EURO|nr:cytochrome p450 domain-containing protein [Penicillium angulare]
MKSKVEKFSQLLSAKAQAGQPANLYLGFRSLFLQIVNEFMFSSIPDHLKSLATPEFDDPLNIATDNAVNWTHWLIRNFPNASALVNKVPRKLLKNITGAWEGLTQVREILEQLVAHEKSPNTPKNNDAMARRFLDAHLDPRSSSTIPHPDEVVVAETEVTMWGGITDMSNILPYATFEVAQNPTLQETLLEELKVSWPDCHGPIPSYEVLSKLPYLNAICNESMRLTHGVVYGPPRQVGSKGAQVDGYFVPPKTKSIVIALSYYVHMDPTLFPEPEKFRPERWFQKDHSNSIMIFSKGRRACPAVQFKVTPYNTTAKDFEWNQYFSIQYNGRHLHAMLEERKL